MTNYRISARLLIITKHSLSKLLYLISASTSLNDRNIIIVSFSRSFGVTSIPSRDLYN